MTLLLLIVWIALVALAGALLALRPKRTHHSRFELNRLADEPLLRRERLLGSVFALRRVSIFLVVGAASMVAVLVFHGWSALVMPTALIAMISLARLRVVARPVNRLYDSNEASLLRFVEKNAWLGIFMLPGDHVPRDQKLESTEQLLHLAESSSFLTTDQLAIIRHGLAWHESRVSGIMIPRSKIVSIKHSELLGPLVLDDLHKSGHSQFPVTKGSLDSVVGMLDITESLEVTSARVSKKVADVMSPRIVHVSDSDPLPKALELLQRSKQHMLIVTDDDGKTVGLVTLADITGSLLGKTGVE